MLAAALVEHLLPRHEADGYAAVGHGEAPAGKIGHAGELPADMVSGSGRHLTAGARDLRSLKTFDKVPSTLVADAVDPGRIKPRGLILIDKV